jgi:hypothetical protein
VTHSFYDSGEFVNSIVSGVSGRPEPLLGDDDGNKLRLFRRLRNLSNMEMQV